MSGPGPGRSSRRREQNQHVPRRALPAHRPTPRQQESHRRGRPFHSGHRLVPVARSRGGFPRPGLGLLRLTHQPRTQEAQPHPPTRSPRLQGHPRTRRLTTSTRPHHYNPSRLRCAPPGCFACPLTTHFRTRVIDMEVHRKALPVVASWTVVALWAAWWAWHMWPDFGVSLHFSVEGSRLLLHGSGLNLFADAPWLQTGPLSLVVAALLGPLPANVASRIKIMAELDIAERRLPQDGRIKIKLGGGKDMDYRVSCLPTLFGEKVVLRLL